MNYSDFISRLATLSTNDPTNPDFAVAIASAIDYAEQRIYRELQLSQTNAIDAMLRTVPLGHSISDPTGQFITLTAINLITPSSATAPSAGVRVPLIPTSWEYIETVYPSADTAGPPRYFALRDPSTVGFGPWPDQAYLLERFGTVRPAPLSSTNVTTVLTTRFPDLFLAAAMISISGFMRNYGAQSDDPQQGVTWASQYAALLGSAQAEERVKKLGAAG